MLIFLYGKDTYRMRQKLKEITNHYREIHKSGLNLKNFDCRELGRLIFNNFKDEARQASMFKEKKLIIITSPFFNADFKEKFLKEAKEFLKLDDVVLFYEEGEINKKEGLFKFLKENARCQEFKPLLGKKLNNWVKKEFEKLGIGISQAALDLLCEYVGDDLWRMDNEIKKLASFCQKEEVKAEDIRVLVRSKIEVDIFKTIDAIAQKNKKRALELLRRHLERGDSPLYLLTMINYQFRNILIIKDFIERERPYRLILKKSGLHPFVVKKSYSQSQKFRFPELKKIYQYILQADLDIKTGQLEPSTTLDLLISKI